MRAVVFERCGLPARPELQTVAAPSREGRIGWIVDRVYETADTRAAFERFAAADRFGWIVVRVGGE
jgi:hypothetical protein